MLSSQVLVDTLKREIRKQGLNYRSVADRLGLSESAVKRMFATSNMSLKRLDQVCDVLGLDVRDLLGLMDKDHHPMEALSEEDEQKLVDNPLLLLVAYCIVNDWELKDILARYKITEPEAIQCLAQLDRMKMIELYPGNRVKRLLGNNFKWQHNGPIERFFRSQVQQQFLAGQFTGDGDLYLVKNGDLSKTAQLRIADRLNMVGRLFDDINRDEKRIPHGQRHGTTMVLAIRHWRYRAFHKFERQPKD